VTVHVLHAEHCPSDRSLQQASNSRQARNNFDGEMLMCILSLHTLDSYGTAYPEQLPSLLWPQIRAYAAANPREVDSSLCCSMGPVGGPCVPKLTCIAVLKDMATTTSSEPQITSPVWTCVIENQRRAHSLWQWIHGSGSFSPGLQFSPLAASEARVVMRCLQSAVTGLV
jgi:hypothetical protein